MSIDPHDLSQTAPMIPGAYERNTNPRRQPGSTPAGASAAAPIAASLMDAATIAEREREGGGSPNERRRKPQPLTALPVTDGIEGSSSWLTRGYLWSQIVAFARR